MIAAKMATTPSALILYNALFLVDFCRLNRLFSLR